MRTLPSVLALCALAGLAVACADDGQSGTDIDSKKQAAKRAFSTRAPDAPVSDKDDPCSANAWYGDGSCDSWCPSGDKKDCGVTADAGVACAEFWSPADGKCDWADPCGPTQDEDCQKGGGSDAGVVCTLIYRLPDGVCDTSDPCSKLQDADCQSDPPVLCPAIGYPVDGKCEAPKGCESNDPDCTTACIEVAWPANGKCEAAKGCESTDPKDCAVACDAIGYLKDGVCSAPKGCEQNDPDC